MRSGKAPFLRAFRDAVISPVGVKLAPPARLFCREIHAAEQRIPARVGM
jgi:hypothetical protein